MTKKDYILYALDSLEKDWDQAKKYKEIVNSLEESEEKTIDLLFQKFKGVVTSLHDKKQRKKLEKSSLVLKNLKEQEMQDKDQDSLELLSLEKELDLILK